MKPLDKGLGKGSAPSSPRPSGGSAHGGAAVPVGSAFLACLAVGLAAKEDQPSSPSPAIHLSFAENGSEGGCKHDYLPSSSLPVIHLSFCENGSESGCEHDQAHGR